jgi:hypothetical protein
MLPHAIIESLYSAFRRYAHRSLDSYSPFSGEARMASEIQVLRSVPLRELTGEQLRYFAFKAMTTWGDVESFKHYLPRIMELSSRFEMDGIGAEIVFAKLAYGKWKTWEEKEVKAVREYILAFWQFLLETEDERADYRIGEYLSAFLEAEFEPEPLLAAWEEASTETAVRRLCLFIVEHSDEILVRGRFGWSGEKAKAHGLLLQQWLRSEKMSLLLETKNRFCPKAG